MRLIDADIFEVVTFTGKSLEFGDGAMAVLEMIDAAPTIKAEPVRHGRWVEGVRWIRTDGKKKSLRWMRCSNCDFRAKPKFAKNYCPNCGAKMDKENDND